MTFSSFSRITSPIFTYFVLGDSMKKIMVVFILGLLFMNSVRAMDTSASCAIVMDQNSNRIIYSKNIHQVRSVASISKIMTAVLAIESGKLDEKVTVGEEILKAYGSAVYLTVGETLTLRDLVYGLMLRSGNDAALAIATYVSGSVENFVEDMNKKANQIGMKNTTFHNPHGLDEESGNMSTAYDMAILTSYAMKNEDYKKIVGTKKYSIKTNKNNYLWKNKNKLLNTYQYTTGGKTGFTEIAKRTLVSTASKENTDLVVVTLNDGNDFNDHKNLYEEAFSSYRTYTVLEKGNLHIPGEDYYRDADIYTKKEYKMMLRDDEKGNIILKYELEKKRNYKSGDPIGVVKVMLDDKEFYQDTLYVNKKDVSIKKSFWEKMIGWFHDK